MSQLAFYDIGQKPPVEESCCAVNPWKSRLALNFKRLPYKTTWVKLPEISKVRSELNVPACRKFADGTDFYTLPILHDPSTNTFVGDSFDIAVYLQKTYPTSGGGDLFPPQTIDYSYGDGSDLLVPLSERRGGEFDEYSRFNMNVDAAFTAHTVLMGTGLPLDPETAHITKAEWAKRAGVKSWDDIHITDEARVKTMQSFELTLADIAKLYYKDTSGPFLLGQTVSYADLIVGGWLRMMVKTLRKEEWEQSRQWHGGVFGQLHDALEVYAQVQ